MRILWQAAQSWKGRVRFSRLWISTGFGEELHTKKSRATCAARLEQSAWERGLADAAGAHETERAKRRRHHDVALTRLVCRNNRVPCDLDEIGLAEDE